MLQPLRSFRVLDVKRPASAHQLPPKSPGGSKVHRRPPKPATVSQLVQRRQRRLRQLAAMFLVGFLVGSSFGVLIALVQQQVYGQIVKVRAGWTGQPHQTQLAANGRPVLSPLPQAKEVWECEVVVIGGSLGGVAAASHAMKSGATTCLIELAPWLGGQVSSQGVSALDESHLAIRSESLSESWLEFKRLIKRQKVEVPEWTGLPSPQEVADLNSCWVGRLCFLPRAGEAAARQLLELSAKQAPASRWQTSVAFKGAEFDATGKEVTAIYAVRRIPKDPEYVPLGRLSKELPKWYAWSEDDTYQKVPLRLQAPAGKRLLVIDATDTAELVGWAGIPYRLGADSQATTGEKNAPKITNPSCTQAFTYPFVLAIHDDRGRGAKELVAVKPDLSRQEHRRAFHMEGFPMFEGKGFFNYRRIVSTTMNDPFVNTAAPGDMTLVNWNQGNDWGVMNPPLILSERQLEQSGQRQNWQGGLSTVALRHAENHALLFAQWLLETKQDADFPLAFLSGADSPMGTVSGLSMIPYFREGRRIVGRPAYGQREFLLRESDLRLDMSGARDFHATSVGSTHYAIDIHGCRDRNGGPSWEATSAPVKEASVRPFQIPLESLIPVGVENVLIGGKGIAVSHIANAVTRIHHGEWTIGAAAGATAGWLTQKAPATMAPSGIIAGRKMAELQDYLTSQGLRPEW